MGCLVKLFFLVAVAQTSVLASEQDWERVASDFFNMNVVCSQCNNELCPRAFTEGDGSERGRGLHWACYIGCRTTCLLQIGPDKYDYKTSKDLCVKECHNEFKSSPDNENIYSASCIGGCSGKVVAQKMSPAEVSRAFSQLDNDETETILFDPSLGIISGGLPRSNYKTIPHKDSLVMYNSIRRRLGRPTYLENLMTFIRDPSTDPTLAAAVAIPFVLLLFATMCYLVYIVTVAKRECKNRRHNNNSSRDHGDSQSAPALRVHLAPDEKKILSSDFGMSDDFIPPPLPPPKYSEIVQTV